MRLTRRRFLLDGLCVTALVPALRVPRRARADERVLVVLQLSGGNDGLNTLVPFRQDGYFRARPTLALKPAGLHRLDDAHGLHPALAPLARLHGEGALTVVHGVGTPRASRSHFRSFEIWNSAEPDGERPRVGWLGRLADQLVARTPGTMPALFVGEGPLPLTLWGDATRAPALTREEDLRARRLPGLEAARAPVLAGSDEDTGGDTDLAFLRATARGAQAAAARLEAAVARAGSGLEFPDLELARRLELVARLLAGGFETRLFLVTHDGFDTHARQAQTHAARLEVLARSLDAFQRALAATGNEGRVLTLVHSEFGRRVEENASRGTDHGHGAPALVLGPAARGGLLGTPPDLERLVDGDVPATTDFRALYAALEHDWLGLAPSSASPPLALLG